MPNQLPLTNARLSSSLVIKAFAQAGFDPLSEILQVPVSPGKILAVVQKFERKQTRDVYRRYQLGTYSMEPRDNIPQKIKTELVLERVVLNSEDILETFGIVFSGSLIEQFLPFLIQEIQISPVKSNGTPLTAVKVFEYTDCWFLDNPISYDAMNTSQIMLQSVTIQCGAVRSLPTQLFQNSIVSTALAAGSLANNRAVQAALGRVGLSNNTIVSDSIGAVQKLLPQSIKL